GRRGPRALRTLFPPLPGGRGGSGRDLRVGLGAGGGHRGRTAGGGRADQRPGSNYRPGDGRSGRGPRPDPARHRRATEVDAGHRRGAISALDGEHFQIPEPVHRFECRIAPTHSGGIYYTPPSDDFSRPGRMWWSVPEGVTEFTTWREKTTVYHEGVPGHHLQTCQAAYQSRSLNTWRRM